MIVKKIVLPMAVAVALVHTAMYGLWFYRSYKTTLGKLPSQSAQQIFFKQDAYYTLHKFLRETPRTLQGRRTRLILVGAQTAAPSRFDQEVYYELYPELPSKYEPESAELSRVLDTLNKGDAILTELKLDLDGEQFSELMGENYVIYRHQ